MDRSIIRGNQIKISQTSKNLFRIIGNVSSVPDRSRMEVPIGTRVYQHGSAAQSGCLANALLKDGSLLVSHVLNALDGNLDLMPINEDVDT